MSFDLLKIANRFLSKEISAEVFVEDYQNLWKSERDSKELLKDPKALSLCLSDIFCIAELYEPEEDREPYELDEASLRLEVLQAIKDYQRRA